MQGLFLGPRGREVRVTLALERTLRRLAPADWLSSARRFRESLRTAGHRPGRLLVVGTAQDEPWHLTAHLEQAARLQSDAALAPVLVRWQVPAGAPAHLSVGLDALHRSARGASVLVAAPGADDRLLERLDDARRAGATLFALHEGIPALTALAHESLLLPAVGTPDEGWQTATHVLAAPAPRPGGRALWRTR